MAAHLHQDVALPIVRQLPPRGTEGITDAVCGQRCKDRDETSGVRKRQLRPVG